jgi:hypothetical protein
VLQRLAGGPALDHVEHGERVVGVDGRIRRDTRLHLAAAQAEHVADEQLGVDLGRRNAGGGEDGDGVVTQRGDRVLVQDWSPTAASCASSSAWMQDSMTGSSAPFITESRL